MGLMSTIKDIGSSFKKIGEGLGDMAKSVAKLDFKGLAEGASRVQQGSTGLVKDAILLTPAGLAGNALTAGALEKGLNKIKELQNKAGFTAISKLTDAADQVKTGVQQVASGVAAGNIGQVASGVFNVAEGGFTLAEAASPKGMAEVAIESGVEVAAGGGQTPPGMESSSQGSSAAAAA